MLSSSSSGFLYFAFLFGSLCDEHKTEENDDEEDEDDDEDDDDDDDDCSDSGNEIIDGI